MSLLLVLPQNHYHPLFCYHLLNGSLHFSFPAFHTPSLHVPLLLVTYLFLPFLSYTSSISSGTPKHFRLHGFPNMKTTVFSNVIPSVLVDKYRRFG
jgi:hypothetical protein